MTPERWSVFVASSVFLELSIVARLCMIRAATAGRMLMDPGVNPDVTSPAFEASTSQQLPSSATFRLAVIRTQSHIAGRSNSNLGYELEHHA